MSLSPSALRARLTGPIAFPVTPFGRDLRLDVPGLRANVRVLLAHPPAAIVAAGGTGELDSLTADEHREVVEAVGGEAGGRGAGIAGIGVNTAMGAGLAGQGDAAGADRPPLF